MAPRRSRPLLCVASIALALSCAPHRDPVATPQVPVAPAPEKAAPTVDPEAAFHAFAARFLADELAQDPTHATKAGEHAHDAKWPDVSVAGDVARKAYLQEQLRALDALDVSGLGLQSRVDLAIVRNRIAASLFALETIKELDWNPLAYTGLIGDGLDPLLTRTFAPLDERMQSVRARLEGIPAIVAIAEQRLQHSPSVHTETAIQQNAGLVALCKKELTSAKTPSHETELHAAASKAAAALEGFQTFLEKDLLKRSDGSFRLGRARFERKLALELGDDVAIDALAAGARALLEQTQLEMAATAAELWPELFKEPLPQADTLVKKKALIRRVLDKLADDHPDNATILRDARALLERATTFVRDHDLVTLPEQPCAVIEMPEYRRGVAVAYCDASGPLEKKPETAYAISPTPKDWTEKRARSFFREYNQSMLAELTVHEAMPGHFLQLMHNNQFDSKLRAVFDDGAFVEGWAVYSEWLMAKYGFGGARVRMQRLKMVLRLAANAVLDHEVHAGAMDEKQALALMMDEAFQEEGEAVGKWRRARLTSAQLSTYYYGFSEMMKLRKAAEGAPGFSERAYHDRLLGYGSPPMKQLATIMSAK